MGGGIADQLATGRCGSRSVERNCTQVREVVQEMRDGVVLGFPDRLIEAAAPARRGDDVPQTDASIGKAGEPRLVGQGLQFLSNGAAQQPPELVGRMSIITAGRKR